MDKALEAALCELYTDALSGEKGKVLRHKIRRIAVRFLNEEKRIRAMDEARIRGANI